MIERAGAAALMLHHAVVSAPAVERAHARRRGRLGLDGGRPGRARAARARPASTPSSRIDPGTLRGGAGYTAPREARTRICPARRVRRRRRALCRPARRDPVGDRADGHGDDDDGGDDDDARRRRPTTTTTTTTTTTPTVPRPTTIAAGVTVGGEVLVGGLSPAEATAEVKAFFARPLTLKLGKVTLRATPKQLGASAYVGDAIRRARIALPAPTCP